MRKLGTVRAIASAILASLIAVAAVSPAAAQLYSPGYQFLEAVDERDGDAVTQMLNEPGVGKTLVNTRDITTGDTGLHLVTTRRDTLWIKFLIQRGADPNIRNKKGILPIQIATRLGMIDGVEQLIKGGAQVDVADRQGETPLISAVHQRNTQLVARLLAQGANPDRNDNSGRSARDYMELMSQNTLLKLEFEKADKERGEQGTQKQYGPSF
ncbi:ankyrin repeat domain-containing protein [Erythrobacter sp. WH158]|uniref:Ankyrin repeat domain-containing protein n=1 Tax=Erythrobacter crassostreae TaxID=2828328 RepID=A0A9X1JKL8_9SPHN|nr:ankyrin repeat domain-containing protein [Erythrobacter crassostrea]